MQIISIMRYQSEFLRVIPLLQVGCIRVTHPCAGRHHRIATHVLPLDLHVLGLSLAFILSQDQTLRCIKNLNYILARMLLLFPTLYIRYRIDKWHKKNSHSLILHFHSCFNMFLTKIASFFLKPVRLYHKDFFFKTNFSFCSLNAYFQKRKKNLDVFFFFTVCH